MGCFGKDERNIGAETRDTMQAQVDLAPQQLAAAQATQGGWDQLTLQAMNAQLFGTGGQGGYLQAYEKMAPRLAALNAADTAANREADAAAMEKYGGRVNQALRAADPQQAALLDKINAITMGDLNAGEELTPEEMRLAQQYSRASSAARGMNGTNLGGSMEVLNQFMLGQNKKQQRLNSAMGVADLNKRAWADPYQVVLGRAGNSVNQAIAGTGQGSSSSQNTLGNTRSQFDPFNGYASQLFGDNYEGQVSTMDKISQGVNVGGELIGGIAKGVALCWVAREVYGARDCRWQWFRAWLLEDAPLWFGELYRKHGERFAAWIHDKPRLKAILRWWMDGRIAGYLERRNAYGY